VPDTPDPLSTWDDASHAIRSAADNGKPRVILAEHLEALDASGWEDLASELERLAEDATNLAQQITTFAEAAEAITDAAQCGRISGDSTDQADLAANLDPPTWHGLGEDLEARSERLTAWAEAASGYAAAIREAAEAVEVWTEAERAEKSDARDTALENLEALVAAEDELLAVFEDYEPEDDDA
jgi:hypothetical protein